MTVYSSPLVGTPAAAMPACPRPPPQLATFFFTGQSLNHRGVASLAVSVPMLILRLYPRLFQSKHLTQIEETVAPRASSEKAQSSETMQEMMQMCRAAAEQSRAKHLQPKEEGSLARAWCRPPTGINFERRWRCPRSP